MATFTAQHNSWQHCKELRNKLVTIWGKMTNKRAWRELREVFGMVGFVRALEITHGENGWHPHLHVLMMTNRPLTDDREEEIERWLYGGWKVAAMACEAETRFAAFDFQRASSAKSAAEYVAKWGAGCEIAKGAEKDGRGGSRSPWQLLDDADGGDAQAVFLFKEYAVAMKGARHLTYSQGIRELYGLREAASDQELAEQTELNVDSEGNETGEIYRFDQCSWSKVVTRGLTAHVLEKGKEGGREAIDDFLDEAAHRSPERPRRHPYDRKHAPPGPPLATGLSPLVERLKSHRNRKQKEPEHATNPWDNNRSGRSGDSRVRKSCTCCGATTGTGPRAGAGAGGASEGGTGDWYDPETGELCA